MPALVREVLLSYKEHTATCTAADTDADWYSDEPPLSPYKAVFYCEGGSHESVPAVLGFRTLFLANYVNIKVEVRHGSGGNGGWMHKCGTGCEWCYDYDDRKEWELEIIESILKKVSLD